MKLKTTQEKDGIKKHLLSGCVGGMKPPKFRKNGSVCFYVLYG